MTNTRKVFLVLTGVVLLEAGCASSGSHTAEANGQLQPVLRAYLAKKFGYFEDPKYRENVEIIGPVKVLKMDRGQRKLTFPDFADWACIPRKMREKFPLDPIEFSYGDRHSDFKSWKRDDLMYVWICTPTKEVVGGLVGYVQVRGCKALDFKITTFIN